MKSVIPGGEEIISDKKSDTNPISESIIAIIIIIEIRNRSFFSPSLWYICGGRISGILFVILMK